MQYEVFIPSKDPDGFDVTLVVEAANWMKALRTGLARTTKEDTPVRNVLCDIQSDNAVHVTDLETNRIFKIRELAPDSAMTFGTKPSERPTAPESLQAKGYTDPRQLEAVSPSQVEGFRERSAGQKATPSAEWAHIQEQVVKASAGAELDEMDTHQEVPAQHFPKAPSAVKTTGIGLKAETGIYRMIGTHEVAAMSREDGAQVLSEASVPTSQRVQSMNFGRDVVQEQQGVTDSSIEDVFLEISDLFDRSRSLEDAVGFCIDLALRHVNAESGAVMFADEPGRMLYFAAARGPKANELLDRDYQVPIGEGIVGFCTRSGVSLAVTDAPKDPRFFNQIASDLNYPTLSIIAAPIQCESQSFGAVELINRLEDPTFRYAELNILTYIGSQLGRFIKNMMA